MARHRRRNQGHWSEQSLVYNGLRVFFLCKPRVQKEVEIFLSRIKEVVCLRQTKILKISNYIYDSYLKNYLFLKNAEKIKYLKYCPFFLWSDQLSEDLASCMTFCTY